MRRARRILILAVVLAGGWIAFWRWQNWLEHSQDVPIAAAATRYGLDPALVKAVVWKESRFHPDVHGRAGELGLMQLRETAAQEWADAEHITNFVHSDCLDPATNTLAGAWYLKHVMNRYARTDDPVAYALADYNAGRGNVLKWTNGAAGTNSIAFVAQIGFPGTRGYVLAIEQRRERYRREFAKK